MRNKRDKWRLSRPNRLFSLSTVANVVLTAQRVKPLNISLLKFPFVFS